MALNIARIPLIRNVTTRGYAQVVPVGGISDCEFKSAVLSNKLVVAAADNESSITRISVVFRAGSRNETADNLGVTHVLRNSVGLSTRNVSQFAIVRNIQQVGANLFATSDRETISYTLEGTKQAVEKALPFLTEVATQQIFKPWELSEITNRLLLDIATRPLQLRAIDLLHNAAFRSGLGNSLFIPKSQIGKISPETIQHYVASNFLTGRASVVGSGVSSSEVEQYANSLKLETGEGCNTPSPYKGGELRSNKGGNIAFVAVAGEGAPLNSKEALALAVLQRAIGVGPQIKWSTRDNGLLSKSIGTSTEDYASSTFNASYADTGLFGILIAAPSRSAGKFVESVVKLLKSSRISDEDVVRGKNQLKTAILVNAESGLQALQDIGSQTAILRGAGVQSASQIAAAVDSVSTSDVQSALKKVGKKLSLASIGNLSNVPYLDELK